MDFYSNDDILLTYLSQIQHNPLLYENLPRRNSILVKTDSKNGATIWAKEIFDYSTSVNLEINKSFLINDTAWSLFFTFLCYNFLAEIFDSYTPQFNGFFCRDKPIKL